ncbi:hypothetical protein GCM10008019_42070 [Deinococcus soli (ex Cha et al. 2016)]|nr:hypothetical protein GCM10008019_42070 [Deinococcus soli (ex Cha et al. 2016)]
MVSTQATLGTAAPYAVASTVDLDPLVTDEQVTPAQLRLYRVVGVQVVNSETCWRMAPRRRPHLEWAASVEHAPRRMNRRQKAGRQWTDRWAGLGTSSRDCSEWSTARPDAPTRCLCLFCEGALVTLA